MPTRSTGRVLVTQVINKVLWKGKKNTAREIVYGALKSSSSRPARIRA